MKPVEGDFFLKELGGSRYLNTDKVLSNSLQNFGDVLKVAADQKAAKQVTPTLLRYDIDQVETLAKNLIEFDANGKPFVRDIQALSDSGYFDILIDQNDRVQRIVLDNIERRTGNYFPTKKEQKKELLRLLDPYLITRQSSNTSTNYQRFTQYRPPSSRGGSGGSGSNQESFNNWYRDLMTGKEEAPTFLKGTTLKGSDLPLPKAMTQKLGDKKLTISDAEFTEVPDYTGMSGADITNALGFGLDVPKVPGVKIYIQPEKKGDDALSSLLEDNKMQEIVIPLKEFENLSKAQLLYGVAGKGIIISII